MIRQVDKTFLINRDPSGYVFLENGKWKRAISSEFESTFELTYNKVIKNELFINDILPILKINKISQTIIEPSQLKFAYFSHEMPFSLLKKIALFHLNLCQRLLEKNFILKDARPDNYQLFHGRIMLIDHLSIIPYSDGAPLFFYREFIERFIGLMILFSSGLKSTFSFCERVPLPDIKKITRLYEKVNLHFLVNITMHSYFYNKSGTSSNLNTNKKRIIGTLQSLTSLVNNIDIAKNSLWKNYYSDESEYQQKKIKMANDILGKYKYQRILNLGSNLSPNLGEYVKDSLILHIERDPQLASQLHDFLIKESVTNQFSINMNAIDIFKRTGEFNTAPSILERFRPDCILLLSIIHHLYDQTNLSVDYIIEKISAVCANIIIEYISVDDLDHFCNNLMIDRHPYPNVDEFENILKTYYKSVEKVGNLSSSRVMFVARDVK